MSDFSQSESVERLLLKVTDEFFITCTFLIDGSITYVNDLFCKITKHTREDLLSNGFKLLHRRFNQGEDYQSIYTTLRSNKVWRGEFKIFTKEGTPAWLDAVISAKNINEETGVKSYIMIATDVTDKVQNKRQLSVSRTITTSRFNAIQEMITLSKPDGTRTFVNKNFCDFFGKPASELIQREYDFDDASTIEEYLAQLKSLTPLRPSITNIHLLTNYKGQQRWIMWSETGIFDEQGNLSEILSIGKDITHLKEAQEEVINQKKFTEEILNNIPADIAVFNPNHQYVFVNKNGISNENLRNWLIGKTDFDYCALKNIDNTVAQMRHENFEHAVKENKQIEWVDEHTKLDGSKKYVLRKLYPYSVDGKVKNVIGYGIDITSIKRADDQKDEYIRQLEQLAFTTSHKIRQPVSNILGLLPMLENATATADDKHQAMEYIKQSALLLDDFTREMSKALQHFADKLTPEQ